MMRSSIWPRPGKSRRLAAGALLTALAGVGLAGCAGNYSVRREVVVTFRGDATPAQHAAARAACTGVAARTTPEPTPTSTLTSVRLNDVRFRVDDANDPDLAKLYNCLRGQPGVLGVSLPTQ